VTRGAPRRERGADVNESTKHEAAPALAAIAACWAIRPQPTAPAQSKGLGPNFLRDRRVAAELAAAADTGLDRPIVELGAGGGALTAELRRLGRELIAVEADPRWVDRLRQRFGGDVRVVHADMLRFAFPRAHHDIVPSVPFGITTPLIRTLLPQPGWSTATLLVQWEVARKRAAVGGGTMLSAAWWPWFAFKLGPRVPARAFRPVPSVDAGVLYVQRRHEPLVPWVEPNAPPTSGS
jgi:23S rRNA (adenine-N6)-dimethyltransferase